MLLFLLLIISCLLCAFIFLVRLVFRFVNFRKYKTQTKLSLNQKRFSVVIGFLFTFPIVCFYFFKYRSENYSTASIKKLNNIYSITVYKEKRLNTHDLFSLLERHTYLDSINFLIPRNSGEIAAFEVTAPNTYFTFNKGNLKIENNVLKIMLHYIGNADGQQKDLHWNGNYKLNSGE